MAAGLSPSNAGIETHPSLLGWADDHGRGAIAGWSGGRAELGIVREREHIIGETQPVIGICWNRGLWSFRHRILDSFHGRFLNDNRLRRGTGCQANCKKESEWVFQGMPQRDSMGGTGLRVLGPV